MDFTLPRTISVNHHHLRGTDLPRWQILLGMLLLTWRTFLCWSAVHHLPVWHRTLNVSTLSWDLQHLDDYRFFCPLEYSSESTALAFKLHYSIYYMTPLNSCDVCSVSHDLFKNRLSRSFHLRSRPHVIHC